MTGDEDNGIYDVADAMPAGPPPAARPSFKQGKAPALAGKVAKNPTLVQGPPQLSERFSYYESGDSFIVVAGPQEQRNVDLALAYGLTYRGRRRLVLVLPEEHAFATLQRTPWLKKDVQPSVHTFTGDSLTRQAPSRAKAKAAVELKAGAAAAADLRQASAPLHLGEKSTWVRELTDWASQHPKLSPAHRRGIRSWQCRGQRVLSLVSGAGKTVSIVAGIHYSQAPKKPEPFVIKAQGDLGAATLSKIKTLVGAAVKERLEGVTFYRPDEHWLQSVLRDHPELVGVEQPALREVPAWRPKRGTLSSDRWGRGFIDLVGLDAAGDLRIVETKLAANKDEMFILQGLDYYVWSQAYGQALRERLGAPSKAAPVIHYVVGAEPSTGSAALSHFAAAQAAALDVPWRAQVVKDWFIPPVLRSGGVNVQVLPEGRLPT